MLHLCIILVGLASYFPHKKQLVTNQNLNKIVPRLFEQIWFKPSLGADFTEYHGSPGIYLKMWYGVVV